MEFTPAYLHAVLARLPEARAYRVAFSGGCDSTVLLHALAALRGQLSTPVSAVHVDHGLHIRSREWSEQAERVCRQLGVPCVTVPVDARPEANESREAAARRARYGALAQVLAPGEALLTAHHQNDQSETFLLQLLRGTGPRGLAAMPQAAPFARGLLLRPLLECSRASLCSYACAHGLRWIDDPSNFDTTFDRNFLRHELMPLLRERWPATDAVIARAARFQGEAAELLDVLAKQDLVGVGAEGLQALHLPALSTLGPVRQRNLLRYVLRRRGLPVPSSVLLERILTELVPAREDAEPLVAWPGGEARRYRDRLYLFAPLPPVPAPMAIPWDPAQPLVLPGGLGVLRAKPVQGRGLRATAGLEVAFRTGGESCQPAGRSHRHALKKLLQEAAVPPWERERMPLVRVGAEVAAVADLFVCAPFTARPDETGWSIEWERFAIETEGENKDNLPGLAP